MHHLVKYLNFFHRMPKLQDIVCRLDGEKEIYKPGDSVSGCWTVTIGESFGVRGIRTALLGVACTRWSDKDPKKEEKTSTEKITTQWKTVFGNRSE